MAYLDQNGLKRFFTNLKSLFVLKANVANNQTTTAEGKVLDARQGKLLRDLVDLKAQTSTRVVNVTAAGWQASGGMYTQTVTVTGVTAENTVLVSPAPDSLMDYCDAVVHASAQGNNTLTLRAAYLPAVNLTIHVLIVA